MPVLEFGDEQIRLKWRPSNSDQAMLEKALDIENTVLLEIESESEPDHRSVAWWQARVVGRLADDPTSAEWMDEMTRIRREANNPETAT
jgi:hypothetical protein